MTPNTTDTTPVRILVVEDEGIVAKDIQLRLQTMGFQVAGEAATGADAVQLAHETRPDLILMDIMLRGPMDGIDAARAVQKDLDVPIVYLTAYSDATTLRRAKETAPLGYVLKPFADRELQIAIEMALFKHRTQQRIVAGERLLATTLRSIGDAVLSVDTEGAVRFMNPVATTLTGWSQDDAVGRPLADVLALRTQDGRPADNLVAQALREGTVVARPEAVTLAARDGRQCAIEDNAAPLTDEQGRTLGVVVAFRDVTEQRREAARLWESELRLSTLFQNLPNVVLYETGAGREFVSDNVEQLLGYPIGLFHNRDFFPTLIHEDDTPRIKQALVDWHAANEPGVLNYQFRVRRADGSYVWLEDHMVEVKAPHARKYMTGVMIDITERKRAEEELRRAKETAEEYDRLKTNFISVISHEIRTPLNAILGCVRLIANTVHEAGTAELEHGLAEYFDIVDRSGARLMKLIESFLDIASIQAGNLKLKIVTLPLDPLVRQAVDELRLRIRDAHLDLVEEYGAENVHVTVDTERLAQVLTNILANAVKFTPKGTIAVRTGVEHDQASVTVHDTGIGIPRAFLPNVFAPFRQGSEGATRGYQGAGLGLSIAQRLTEAMGGTVTITSHEGSGTTLGVRFPVTHEIPTSTPAEAPPKPRGERVTIAGRGRGVLIVEDDPENLQYIRTLLHRAGWSVETATSGNEALVAVERRRPDLILMDINLGGAMTGFDTLKALRELGVARTPVVAVTAHAFDKDRLDILAAGFDDYLAKPFTPDQLREAVARCVTDGTPA